MVGVSRGVGAGDMDQGGVHQQRQTILPVTDHSALDK